MLVDTGGVSGDKQTEGSGAEGGSDILDGNATIGVEVDGEDAFVEDQDEREEEEEDSWFTINTDELDAAAAERATALQEIAAEDGVLDLGAVDEVGRDLMSVAGYERVVNVDVDAGGALEEDEDNNDLLSGVGFDAVLDDERLVRIMRKDFGYKTTTHVQLSAMPRISDGSDVMIQSYTGTGKTLAFLLPIFETVDPESTAIQAVVVAPTRELAMQITREAERLCAGSDIRVMPLIGGANPARQADRLRFKPPQVVVGTPGRLAELEGNRVLRLRKCRTVVVDEIDQCMQESFVEHLEYLFTACPRDRQIVFASATGDNDAVRAYAQKWMRAPELLRVAGERRVPKNLEHWCTVVPARMRIDVLRRLMTTKDAPRQAICFVDNPRRVDIVCERLFEMKLAAGALRGNAHKLERAEVLRLFRKGAVPLLVTTEVAARGLDVPEVTHVFNLDLPTDADHYVHRAGRTGRAGVKGIVVSIATAETAFVITKFEKELDLEIKRMEPRGGVYAPPLQRTVRPRTESERRRSSERVSGQGDATLKRSASTAPKGVPSAKAAAAAAAAAAIRAERDRARFGPRPRSVAKRNHSTAGPSLDAPMGSDGPDSDGYQSDTHDGESSFRRRDSEYQSRGYSSRTRDGRFESRQSGGGGYQRGDESTPRRGGAYQSRGGGSNGMRRRGGFETRDEGRRTPMSRSWDERRSGGRNSKAGGVGLGEGDYERRGRFQSRGDVQSRGGGRGGRVSPGGDRRGGAAVGRKPTGAELRLQNKESKKMREQSKRKGGDARKQSGPSSPASSAPSSTLDFSDDDDDDGEGWFIPGEAKKNAKIKKKKAKRKPASPQERAALGQWVGNRANVNKPPGGAGAEVSSTT